MIKRWPVGVAGAVWVAISGCNGVVANQGLPSTSNTFEATIENKVIDRVDLLFDIENSGSMGDKQAYLKQAIPDLVNRLVNPNCVDANTGVSMGSSNGGNCSSFPNAKPEFAAVHDLHLGILSSSLGPRGGDACDPQAMAAAPFDNVLAHDDDQAHLLNRSLTFSGGTPPTAVAEGTVADANMPDPFLYYFPTSQNVWQKPSGSSPIQSAPQLITDFADVVGGTGVFGCGLESPLESWYRFLVQPDPYGSISVNGGKASWSGVDRTILQQRHDFLRPDSRVIVVVVSGDDDREVDVRSVGGLGYKWLSSAFDPPRGTSACATDPGSPACKSCTEPGTAGDPSCRMGSYSSPGDGGHDLATRFAHMKAKYGVDPQYPVQRYANGLTSSTVPDRAGEYPPGAPSYVGTNNCQNPLFAAVLPDGSRTDAVTLCHAPPGPRTKDLVFYIHIGGVPHQLLHFTPGDARASQPTPADWVKILGRDPLHYDLTGIDPHMIESDQPRPGVAPPGSANDADPINGHDWTTGGAVPTSLEYACIFPLATPRDCTLLPNQNFCDCPRTAGSVDSSQLPPICDTNNFTQQTGAKAFPTTRQLLVAKLMGNQAKVASLCPEHVTEMMPGDPLYGYRSAFDTVVDRLYGETLPNQCLPQTLAVDPKSGEAPCTFLLQIASGSSIASGTCLHPSCQGPTFVAPDPQLLSTFCAGLEDRYHQQVSSDGGSTMGWPDPANVPVCELRQLNPKTDPADFQGSTCSASPEDGWCYVTGAAAGHCPQAIAFTKNALPNGATGHLTCASR